MFYPEDHVSQLNNLEGRYLHDVGVEPKSGVVMKAPVDDYRRAPTEKRSNIRWNLNNFMAKRAKDPDSCVWEIGEGKWAIYGVDPVYSISDTTFRLVLTGKGTVKEIKDVLKVVSLMLERNNPCKALYYCTSLRDFVDQNVGHDCNGLVFSYFRAAQGLTKVEDKKCWLYRDFDRARKSPGEVRELDLVFPSDGGHILIIGRIWNRTADSFECNICEARNVGEGGAQSHRYRVKLKKGVWELDFLDKVEWSRKMGLICSPAASLG